MTNLNEVTLRFFDKRNRMAAINVNRKSVGIIFETVYKDNGFDTKTEYSCRVANDWNMSNPITFQAKTPKGLVGKLKRHKYNLVPFKM